MGNCQYPSNWQAGQGLLPGVVVYKGKDRLPGKEFLNLAHSRGGCPTDRKKYWEEECQKVYLAYSERG